MKAKSMLEAHKGGFFIFYLFIYLFFMNMLSKWIWMVRKF